MTAGSAQVAAYDNVRLPNATVTMNAVAVYDSSGRTLQGHSITFSIKSYIFAETTGTPNPQLLMQYLTPVRQALSHSRKRLNISWNNPGSPVQQGVTPVQITQYGAQNIFDIGPGGTMPDLRWGPRPKNYKEKIIGGTMAIVEVEIETFVNMCPSFNAVEEFWWSFSYDTDRNMTVTRTITGRLRVNTSASNGDGQADYVFAQNSLYWPGVPLGFYRESLRRTLSPDGLQLDFTCVDKQVWRTLPQPMTDGDYTFRMEQQGAILFKTLTGFFQAPLDINKRIIIQFIVSLIRAKFPNAFNPADPNQPNTNPTDPKEMFTTFVIQDEGFNNRVSFSITSRSGADNALKSPLDYLFGDVADIVPGEDDQWLQSNGQSYYTGPTGTAGLIGIANQPFDVCTQGSGSETPGQVVVPADSGKPPADGANPTSPFSPIGPGAPITSDQQRFYPYTLWIETWLYMLDRSNSLVPTTGGQQAIVMQTSTPTMKIIQTGRAIRLGAPPDLPSTVPVINGNLYLNRQSVQPAAPQILANGLTLEFRTAWTYEYLGPADSNFSGATIPSNPQIDADTIREYQTTYPVVVPQGSNKSGELTPIPE